jgi:hypothetical protein
VTDESNAADSAGERGTSMAAWAQQVGRFVIAFGEIEYSVCQTLVHVPEVNQFPAMKHRDFKVRAKPFGCARNIFASGANGPRAAYVGVCGPTPGISIGASGQIRRRQRAAYRPVRLRCWRSWAEKTSAIGQERSFAWCG